MKSGVHCELRGAGRQADRAESRGVVVVRRRRRAYNGPLMQVPWLAVTGETLTDYQPRHFPNGTL